MTSSLGTVYKVCEHVAVEDEPYTVSCPITSKKGKFVWRIVPSSKQSNGIKKIPDIEECRPSRTGPECYGPYISSLNETHISLTLRNVTAVERDTILKCTNYVNIEPVTREICSCQLLVHAKPQTPILCRINQTNLSSFRLKCLVRKLFPRMECRIHQETDSVETPIAPSNITYENLTFTNSNADYINASCAAEFTHLKLGNYSVVVSVISSGQLGSNFTTEVHRQSFSLTSPRPYITLKSSCRDRDKSTLSFYLQCQAEHFSQIPEVMWFWNAKQMQSTKKNNITYYREGTYHLLSRYMFQHPPMDQGTEINCTVRSSAETLSATFIIPKYASVPPEFINPTSAGELFLNEGKTEITCRIPGEALGFVKLNISCFVNGSMFTQHVSPGSVGSLKIKITHNLDLAICRCSAIHSVFCYTKVAEVTLRVKRNFTTSTPLEIASNSQSVEGIKYDVAYIALATSFIILLIFIIGIILHSLCKRLQDKDIFRRRNIDVDRHYANEDHIYSEPEENALTTHCNSHETEALVRENPGTCRGVTIDSHGYLKPHNPHNRLLLPDVVSDSDLILQECNLTRRASDTPESSGSWVTDTSEDFSITCVNSANQPESTHIQHMTMKPAPNDLQDLVGVTSLSSRLSFSHNDNMMPKLAPKDFYITPISTSTPSLKTQISSDQQRITPRPSSNQTQLTYWNNGSKNSKSLNFRKRKKPKFSSTCFTQRETESELNVHSDSFKDPQNGQERGDECEQQYFNFVPKPHKNSSTSTNFPNESDYLELHPLKMRQLDSLTTQTNKLIFTLGDSTVQ
ncbi:hypothetical protein Bpfe_030370 [Biomphalaria pfeifferi]|uniref:Ig-like domain-containing protein n=1 Tax=Biomphalaria pfeifferi TaxID=112525 RepID=A0AAD8AQP9_BIOPF|nr:hypothetical protein Bpfe_030370 [Biomphalaria pfeifferi]